MACEGLVAEPLELMETVAARLCHDLSGLAGTLLNTLEMAEEEGGGEALAIAADAGRALAGRVRLLRAAWGGAGGAWDPAFLAELMSHAAGFPRTRTDWSGCGRAPLDAAVARVVLNVALTSIESLPRGGVAHVAVRPDGTLAVTLDGPGAGWPASLMEPDAHPGPAEPRKVQPLLTALFARADGIALSSEPSAPQTLVVRRC